MRREKSFDFSAIKFEETNCIYCKTKTKKRVVYKIPDRLNNVPGLFTLVKCQKCNLVFQDPRPSEKYISHYYPKIWYEQKEIPISPLQKNIIRYILINYYQYTNLGKKNFLVKFALFPIYSFFLKQRSIPEYQENGKILEIGCSVGIFLKELEETGWDVQGLELNEKASLLARKKRGLDVKSGSISDFDYKKGTFDVIIMDMVIAHLYRPDLALKKITKWLKKDGQLIFSTPYFAGFEYTHFKEYSYGLHLPAHLYYFNKEIISAMLKDSFKSVKFVFHNTSRDMTSSAQFRYQDTQKFTDKFIGYNKFIRPIIKLFVYILSLLNKTSRVTVFAVKR